LGQASSTLKATSTSTCQRSTPPCSFTLARISVTSHHSWPWTRSAEVARAVRTAASMPSGDSPISLVSLEVVLGWLRSSGFGMPAAPTPPAQIPTLPSLRSSQRLGEPVLGVGVVVVALDRLVAG